MITKLPFRFKIQKLFFVKILNGETYEKLFSF